MSRCPPALCAPADWDSVESGDPHRYFVGSSWVIDRPDRDEDLQVWLDGVQRPHRIDRYIVVNQLHADYPIAAEQARELATALIAAADECEQMAGYDRIVV